jgi:signal transduction histidine kinase
LTNGTTLSAQRDVYRRSDGSSFTVSFTSAPITEEGRVTGAVIVFADASEQAEIERSKDEFVSLVSHELRTPLTSLKGSLGLVVGGVFGPLSPDAKAMLDVAVANTDRLVRLVNDILDLQRVDAGRLPLDLQAHPLIQLVVDSGATVEGMYTQRQIGLENRFDGVDDVVVRCDGDRIVQVLTNLLGNAAKFSSQGSVVSVMARVELDPATGGEQVVIDVTDRGRGIPEDRLGRIFERFEQVDSSDARHGSGTGLGLTIARALVDEHGGRLSVTSAPGIGSTFTVRLPIAGPRESSVP